jgi:hypothetical protein
VSVDTDARAQALRLLSARLVLRHAKKMLEKRVKQQRILFDFDVSERGDVDHRWRRMRQHRRQCR